MKNFIITMAVLLLLSGGVVWAENIDPDNNDSQYAYGENVGWINFEADGAGATISREKLAGYIWAENIGWINLWPTSYGGVFNDDQGNLSGYAWGENVGWINFDPQVSGDPTEYGVKIDSNGNFSGWAWGENIGWINFDDIALSGQGVKVCVVNYLDLKNFADQWLLTGKGLEADLWPVSSMPDGEVEFRDFAVFAGYWLDYCPDGWEL